MSVKLHLFHELGDNGDMSGHHCVTSVEDLVNYSFCRRRVSNLKKQTLNEGGDIVRFSTCAAASYKNNKFILVVV